MTATSSAAPRPARPVGRSPSRPKCPHPPHPPGSARTAKRGLVKQGIKKTWVVGSDAPRARRARLAPPEDRGPRYLKAWLAAVAEYEAWELAHFGKPMKVRHAERRAAAQARQAARE